MLIGSNIPALSALANINRTGKKTAISMLRLSSGIKINYAKEDAAGLAISNKLTNQVRGTQMAGRNSLNGVSVIQTADGALASINEILQRVRELSVQAATGTMEKEDRQAIELEVNQLKDELNSFSKKAEYNKIKLLSGGAGINAWSKKAVISKFTDGLPEGDYKLGVTSLATKSVYTMAEPKLAAAFPDGTLAGELYINDTLVEITATDTDEDVYKKIATTASLYNIDVTKGTNGAVIGTFEAQQLGSGHGINISSSNAALLNAIGINAGSSYIEGKDAVVQLNTKDKDPTSNIAITATYSVEGNRVTIMQNGEELVVDLSESIKDDPKPSEVVINVEDYSLIFHIGANKDMSMKVTIPKIDTVMIGIEDINFQSDEDAQRAIEQCDAAISHISDVRAKMGAYQNRLDQIVSNLDNADQNLQAALSRIKDTDMAREMTELSKEQIVSQAGVSILAQANQRPQLILQLLQ